MKKVLVNSILYILCVILGMMIYRNNWFPIQQLVWGKHYFFPYQDVKKTIPKLDNFIRFILTPYLSRTPLFSDRDYYDTICDNRLKDSYLIQIPRHFNSFIAIEVYKPVIIYRILSNTNDNTPFYDWKKTNIEVNVKGASCSHTRVVSKIFEPGKIILNSGGPVAASPILIQEISKGSINWPIKII
jgi:hypothetical protein